MSKTESILEKADRIIAELKRMKPVDEWHPASDLPKPEDFEPTGKINVIWEDGKASMQDARQLKYHFPAKEGYEQPTHWRKITPPSEQEAQLDHR